MFDRELNIGRVDHVFAGEDELLEMIFRGRRGGLG